MNNRVLASTGTMIARYNNYDFRLVAKAAPKLDCDGFELMMLPAYYEHQKDLPAFFRQEGLTFPVFHAEKLIGDMISRHEEGEPEEAARQFEINCEMAAALGCERIVLHLWGGRCSDSNIAYNIDFCARLIETAEKNGVRLTIENIPCTTVDPLTHWKELQSAYPGKLDFIFDTRFGGFHSQLSQVFEEGWFNGAVRHVHVSDFTGPPRDFRTLRPILHPGEGIVDLDTFFGRAIPVYDGTITLESPVCRDDGSLDLDKLNASLQYIRKQVRRK